MSWPFSFHLRKPRCAAHAGVPVATLLVVAGLGLRRRVEYTGCRLQTQCFGQSGSCIYIYIHRNVDNSQPWYVALAVLVCFSLFVQMAEGTSLLGCFKLSASSCSHVCSLHSASSAIFEQVRHRAVHAIHLLRKLGDDGNLDLRDQVAKFWLSSNMGVPY